MTRIVRRGVSLPELLLVFLIEMLAIVISVQAFISLNQDYKIVVSYFSSYLKGREIVDIISKDSRESIRVLDSYAGYSTNDSCIILKTPSIDTGGNIIDVNKKFDYIIYKMTGRDLWKIVIPGTGSSRQASNAVFKKDVDSLQFANSGTAFSLIPHKSTIAHFTMWVSVSEVVLGKSYGVTPGTTVKLMNYEWEFVR